MKPMVKNQVKINLLSIPVGMATMAALFAPESKILTKAGEKIFNAINSIKKATPAQKGLGVLATAMALIGTAIASKMSKNVKANMQEVVSEYVN